MIQIWIEEVTPAIAAIRVRRTDRAIDQSTSSAATMSRSLSAQSAINALPAARPTVLVVAGQVDAGAGAVRLAGGAAEAARAGAVARRCGAAAAVLGVGGEVHAGATAIRHVRRAADARLTGAAA